MDTAKVAAAAEPSAAQGRLLIILAALLWSTSGAFTKVLTKDTPLALHTPSLAPLQIAFYRALFAGLALVLFLRRGDVTFRPLMVPMAAIFAVMNASFVAAMALGTAANAIFLQYTAPVWMYLAGVWWLGERREPRTRAAILVSLVGIGVIVAGGWQEDQLSIVALGLGSGMTYAGVVLCLRVLRGASSLWLTALNHLVSAAVLVPVVWGLPLPGAGQFLVLFVYGAVQMSIPYALMARGLRTVSPAEAGTITLLEPVLNPCWAYLVSGEEPSPFTLVGGAVILGALAYRYWPAAAARSRSPGPIA